MMDWGRRSVDAGALGFAAVQLRLSKRLLLLVAQIVVVAVLGLGPLPDIDRQRHRLRERLGAPRLDLFGLNRLARGLALRLLGRQLFMVDDELEPVAVRAGADVENLVGFLGQSHAQGDGFFAGILPPFSGIAPEQRKHALRSLCFEPEVRVVLQASDFDHSEKLEVDFGLRFPFTLGAGHVKQFAVFGDLRDHVD